jgi:hypothetical protein
MEQIVSWEEFFASIIINNVNSSAKNAHRCTVDGATDPTLTRLPS